MEERKIGRKKKKRERKRQKLGSEGGKERERGNS